jgi:RimJ/RimL family protein N-acetyltransferase
VTRHVRLRMLTGEDAAWVIDVDAASAGPTANAYDWNLEKLVASLDEGYWATESRVAWAITNGSTPIGFALVTNLDTGAGTIAMRILPAQRGQGVGRTVLHLLADHHFTEDTALLRLAGQTHEANVPMQRAFVASGFRMEARYRDAFMQADGNRASEWGYALTRSDWTEGRLSPSSDFNLHGRQFVIDSKAQDASSADIQHVVLKVLQEGRRVLVRYEGGAVHDGEAAGLLLDDALTLCIVHEVEVRGSSSTVVTGQLQGRLQRLGDGRFEMLASVRSDDGRTFDLHLVEPNA